MRKISYPQNPAHLAGFGGFLGLREKTQTRSEPKPASAGGFKKGIQARQLRRGAPRVGDGQGSPPYTSDIRTTEERSFFTGVASK